MAALLEPALRFLHYAALLGLFGWTAFRLIGLRGVGGIAQVGGTAGGIGAAVAAPLLSVTLLLASIAAMMGVPITALDWATIEAMILTTGIGWAMMARVAFLLAALLALLLHPRFKIALPIAAGCFAGALLTLGWSGHAAATEGALGLVHRLNNGIHLVAAGLWLGAIGWFLRLTIIAHSQPDHMPATILLAAMHRFAPLGVSLVATVAITGLINAQMIFGLENSGTVVATGYGVVFAAKILLVGAMLGFGAHNAAASRRGAQGQAANDCSTALSSLRRSLGSECALAFSVLGLVAILGTLSPMAMG